MRQLRNHQCRTSFMDHAALDFITDNGLVQQTEWPSFVIKITEAGAAYIAENGGDE